MKCVNVLMTAWVAAAAACSGGTGSSSSSSGGGGAGTGTVQVFLSAEANVTDGLVPGPDAENIQDGWTITYQKFLVNVGDFDAHPSTSGGSPLRIQEFRVLNLQAIPTNGYVWGEFSGVDASRQWDKVSWAFDRATAASVKDTTATQADFDRMVQGGFSVYVEGTMTNPAGTACIRGDTTQCSARTQVTFNWGFTSGTRFGDCAPEMGQAGFSVPTGGTTTVQPTVYGDHWYFTTYEHGVAQRRAQWIADSDLNSDGETTLEELSQVTASDVFPPPVYNLGGAPTGTPINTALDYAVMATRTMGHFEGDGECATRTILH